MLNIFIKFDRSPFALQTTWSLKTLDGFVIEKLQQLENEHKKKKKKKKPEKVNDLKKKQNFLIRNNNEMLRMLYGIRHLGTVMCSLLHT